MTLTAVAQAPVSPTWGWAVALTSTRPGIMEQTDMAVDAAGNTYVTGIFEGTQTFGSFTLTTPIQDNFLLKLNPTGSVEWVEKLGNDMRSGAAAIALDATGNVYLTGVFRGQMVVGSTTLTSASSSAYVAKFTPQGTAIWAKQSTATGYGYASGHDIAVDATGNVYLSGTFGYNITFGPNSLSTTTTTTMFLVKYDATGTVQWALQDGATDATRGIRESIAIAPDGYIYLFASAEDNIIFGATAYNNPTGEDCYLAKYDSLGSRHGVQQFSGTGSASGFVGNVTADANGSVYVTFSFSGTFTLGSTVLQSNGSQYTDIALVKYTNQGAIEWVQTSGGTQQDYARSVAIDAAGNPYLVACFIGPTTFGTSTFTTNVLWDAVILSYTPQGTLRWVTTYGGVDADDCKRIGFDGAGVARVTGHFTNQMSLGTITLTAAGSTANWYVAQLFDPLPPVLTVASLAPSSGGPGQAVTVLGSGFAGVIEVLFNGTPASAFTVQSATRLEAIVPAGATVGPISVRTSASTSSSNTNFQPTPLSTSAPLAINKLPLYPNPATSAVYLSGVSARSEVQLLDALGRVVRTTTIASDATVSVRGLTAGLYVVRAIDAQGRQYTGRLMVE